MYIGVDLGTSSLKLILIDNMGKVVKEVSKVYKVFTPKPLWSEQNPEDWFEAFEECLKELTLNHNNIKGISFSGQMHGLVILDNEDNVIRPCILWNDQRTFQEIEEIENKLGESTIFRETSNKMFTGCTAVKVLWVKNNEKENFAKIKKVMNPKDYLIYKLTGEYVTDVSDCSGTLYYNVREKKYSHSILNYLGLSEKMMPKVLETQERVGPLKHELKEKYKLTGECILVVGGADNAVSAISTYTLNENTWSLSLGTSGVLLTPTKKIRVEDPSIHTFCSANNGYYHMGVTLGAASSLALIKELIASNISYEKMFEKLDVNLKTSISFLPYISGERAPILDPFAEGTLIGLKPTTTKEDILKGVLEGITFSFKQIITIFAKSGLKLTELTIIGGGARNDKWIQIIADILECNIKTIKNNYGAAYGAALIAMAGTNNDFKLEDLSRNNITYDKVFSPNLNNKKYYEIKFKNYNKLYHSLKHYWHN
jgi:xylulokinase